MNHRLFVREILVSLHGSGSPSSSHTYIASSLYFLGPKVFVRTHGEGAGAAILLDFVVVCRRGILTYLMLAFVPSYVTVLRRIRRRHSRNESAERGSSGRLSRDGHRAQAALLTWSKSLSSVRLLTAQARLL